MKPMTMTIAMYENQSEAGAQFLKQRSQSTSQIKQKQYYCYYLKFS